MKTTRSRGRLLARLERLESRTVAAHMKITVRFGHLRQLPGDYKGERHVVVTKELPEKGEAWVEFEEVPGPDPHPGPAFIHGLPVDIDVYFVGPRPYGQSSDHRPAGATG